MAAQTGAPEIRGDTVPSHAVEGGRWMEPAGATGLLHAPHRGENREVWLLITNMLEHTTTTRDGLEENKEFSVQHQTQCPEERVLLRTQLEVVLHVHPHSFSQGLPVICLFI